MNAPVTRRALLGATTTAIGAAALPAAALACAARMPVGDPDSVLLDLIVQHAEAEAAVEQADAASSAAWLDALRAYPPRPEALRWRPGDFPRTSFGTAASDRGEEEGSRHYGERGVGWLREREPFPVWATRVGAAMTAEEAEACEARRLQILTAWDDWQAGRRSVEDFVGYTAAVANEDAAAGLVIALACEIKRARPATLAGLQALAAWVKRQAEDDAAHDDLLALFAGVVVAFSQAAS